MKNKRVKVIVKTLTDCTECEYKKLDFEPVEGHPGDFQEIFHCAHPQVKGYYNKLAGKGDSKLHVSIPFWCPLDDVVE